MKYFICGITASVFTLVTFAGGFVIGGLMSALVFKDEKESTKYYTGDGKAYAFEEEV